MSRTLEKFLRYVQINTESDDAAGTTPSTRGQFDLADMLVRELEEMGAADIYYDREHCYVYASVPAAPGYEDAPVLGFVAHMDTSPAMSGANVRPRIVSAYEGGDILLNERQGIVLRASDFPEIAKYAGQDLVVTDGTTLLGADDKAGIAEIMAMAEQLLTHPEIPHRKIRIGFTPDEEVGAGANFFDVGSFGAAFAYTVDGGALGELEYENFNAADAVVTVRGRSVHPGSAKNKMKNALLIAQEFQGLLPAFDNPMYTERYEGFYHLDKLHGSVDHAEAEYIIRDHDKGLFEGRKTLFLEAAAFLNRKYGEGTVTVKLEDSYYNMRELLTPHMHLIDNARTAMEEMGIAPIVTPIRGGTDGARLSYMGLPCPNLCAGGENFHGRYEFISVQSMETITQLLIRIVQKYA